MRQSGEFPLIPEPAPEEETHYWRFESSDLDIGKLTEYLHQTIFESEKAIEEFLVEHYMMSRRVSIGDIEAGMTRSWDLSTAIDIVDENGILKKWNLRSPENTIEFITKIRDAWMNKKNHVLINGFGLLISEEMRGKLGDLFGGKPLSGIDPQAVARINIRTTESGEFDLRIFRIYNRNKEFRYEYILEPK
ncbi:MAG: hypothetical protein AB200_02200 [Parcubacteria bacterium C7867-005]|nr:MAG: hypothetical protein AB200_02200 [Parcubacteria bacterium C7867-005]